MNQNEQGAASQVEMPFDVARLLSRSDSVAELGW